MLDSLRYDLRHAARVLAAAPRHTATAVAILGLAIGCATAMFSGINHVLVRPLPFPDAERVLRIRDRVKGSDGQIHAFNMASRDVLAIRELPLFDGIVAFSGDSLTLAGHDVAERLSVVYQTDGADRTLGVRPAVGRGLTSDETLRGLSSGAAIVSDAWAHARFGGTSEAIGASLPLGGRSFTIVGVMPPGYAFPYEAQVWLPHALDPTDTSRDFAVFAHMRPGVTREMVRDALAEAASRLRSRYVGVLRGFGFETMTIRENLVGVQDAPLRALAEIVAFLLLVACVNVATLLLARAVTRRREFAVRAALGAGRGRHVRQLLAESLLLALAGCGVGILVAVWLGPLTARLVPSVLSGQLGLATPATDWRVASFAGAAAILSALVAGVFPALGTWRAEPGLALTEGGRTQRAGRTGTRMLNVLIVAETAFTLVLLAGAGVVIRHFVGLQTASLGFEARGLLVITATPPVTSYPFGPPRSRLLARVLDEVRHAPGVVRAAATTVNPLGDGTWGAAVASDDMVARDPQALANVNFRLVTPGLFGAMRIPLLRGRDFGSQDAAGSLPVVIVSEAMARRLWSGREALGRRVRMASPGSPWLTVVGVAGDVADSHDPGVPLETCYLPFEQHAESAAGEKIYLMIRAAGEPLALVPAVRRAAARVDKGLALYNPAAMDRYYSDSLQRDRAGALFMVAFGSLGLILAALGVYGVMAFSVAQRAGEIGIRMALGAMTGDIVPLVLRRSAGLVAAGTGFGTLAAVRLNQALLRGFGEAGRIDLPVVGGAAVLILAAAGIACLVPALAAARLDPLAAVAREG